MSRLAFVGQGSTLRVADTDGANLRPLTPDGLLCTWPTWSPNGDSIAFSGFRFGSNGHGLQGMYTVGDDGEPPRLIYTNEPGTDAIAQRTPHYALWSPDGTKLAFIAQTLRGGLTLFVHDSLKPDAAIRVLDGGPLYVSWSRDSQYMVAHSGQLHYLITTKDMETAQIPVVSRHYMAPSWSPSSNEMAMFGEVSANHQGLLVASTDGGQARMLAEVEGAAAFAWES